MYLGPPLKNSGGSGPRTPCSFARSPLCLTSKLNPLQVCRWHVTLSAFHPFAQIWFFSNPLHHFECQLSLNYIIPLNLRGVTSWLSTVRCSFFLNTVSYARSNFWPIPQRIGNMRCFTRIAEWKRGRLVE